MLAIKFIVRFRFLRSHFKCNHIQQISLVFTSSKNERKKRENKIKENKKHQRYQLDSPLCFHHFSVVILHMKIVTLLVTIYITAAPKI